MVFPQPKHENYFDDLYVLKRTYNTDDLFCFWKDVKDGSEDISYVANDSFTVDEYELIIASDGIKISSFGEEGKFRAVTSLRQLLFECQDKIRFAEIHDAPQFKKRAYMLDISNKRVPLVSTLKDFIDKLAELKYNELQLYMDSFCFKYEAYPFVTEDIDCLTAEDIKEIESYCEERFIELVPNQNGFGHMFQWLKRPEFAHLAVGDHSTGTLNVLMPESLEFMENIYESLLPHFKSGYVNIGLDEATGLGKYQLEKVCEEKGRDTVFMEWLNKLNDICKTKYNKKVMFWDDMIVDYADSFDKIPKDVTVMSWSYELIQSQMWAERVMPYEEKGLRFYMCCCNALWDTFTGRSDVMSFNLRAAGEIGRKHGAEGYMLTDWGCGSHPTFMPFGYIACALAGQYSWNPGIKQTGGWPKNEYVYAAREYADKYMFKVKIANLISRLSDYYMYEPERPFGVTCSFESVYYSMETKKFEPWFDMTNFGDTTPFYFNNVINHIEKVISDIRKVNMDSYTKREIILNAEMVILGARLMLHRDDPGDIHFISQTIGWIDYLIEEYKELWLRRNFKSGVEGFVNVLLRKKKQLNEMISKQK